ncbi:hypothetical protein, partial [Pseudoalteromonas ruthenica]|uniref:hypothetical protein n=1 Tax=Pseudoalteromonas ruthenica TaxID=151081 RepID=UPI001109B045
MSTNSREGAEVVHNIVQDLAHELTVPKLENGSQISDNKNIDHSMNLTLSSGQYISNDVLQLDIIDNDELELTLNPNMTLLLSRINA